MKVTSENLPVEINLQQVQTQEGHHLPMTSCGENWERERERWVMEMVSETETKSEVVLTVSFMEQEGPNSALEITNWVPHT